MGLIKVEGQRVVVASLEVDHKSRKSLINAFVVARRATIRSIALLGRRNKRSSTMRSIILRTLRLL